jgi:hypothetical protein
MEEKSKGAAIGYEYATINVPVAAGKQVESGMSNRLQLEDGR